ncbi:MAG: CDP-alcohol phosphatidyltransferase family protein [Bacteroidia bacterium]|nr:CDP-alcohol phosphatidyltransferase family protein [Bacteroidia bacterium]
MPSIYQLKPWFQRQLSPCLDWLYRHNISANTLTFSGIFLSLLVGGSICFVNEIPFIWLIMPFAMILRMGFNALDGMMARKFKQGSEFGEVLNEMGDMISDIFIYLPLALAAPFHAVVVVLFVVLSLLNEAAGILAKAIAGERRYDGPMGKSDRAMLLGLMALLIYFLPKPFLIVNVLLTIASLLMVISTFNRLKFTLS